MKLLNFIILAVLQIPNSDSYFSKNLKYIVIECMKAGTVAASTTAFLIRKLCYFKKLKNGFMRFKYEPSNSS
jgi:hypothetical protein